MKKVLIISWNYPPIKKVGCLRIIKFCRQLRKMGWRPVILTVKTPGTKEKEIHDGISIYRTPERQLKANVLSKLFYFFRKFSSFFGIDINEEYLNLLLHPDKHMGWIKPSLKEVGKIIKKEDIDIVYASSPPHSCSVIGAETKRKFNLPFVMDYRDEWTITPEIKNLVYKKDEKLESYFIKKADHLIFNTHPVEVLYRKKYNLKNTDTIPNSYPENIKAADKINKKEFIIFYAGVINEERDPTLLFRAINRLNKKDIKFLYVGNKKDKASVRRLAEKEGIIDKCMFRDYMPQEDLAKLMYRSSLLFLPQNETLYTAVASKAYEYLRTGLPILVYYNSSPAGNEWIRKRKDHETTKIIRKYSRNSYYVLTDNLDEMEDALSDAYGKWKKGKLKAYVDREFINKYSEEKLTRKLASVLDSVSG